MKTPTLFCGLVNFNRATFRSCYYISRRTREIHEELVDTTESMDYSPFNFVWAAFVESRRYRLLIFELSLFALILVLTRVELPDFTFPGGTAPIAARTKLSPPLAFSALDPARVHIGETATRVIQPAVHLNPFSAVTLSCILRC